MRPGPELLLYDQELESSLYLKSLVVKFDSQMTMKNCLQCLARITEEKCLLQGV